MSKIVNISHEIVHITPDLNRFKTTIHINNLQNIYECLRIYLMKLGSTKAALGRIFIFHKEKADPQSSELVIASFMSYRDQNPTYGIREIV